MSTLNLVRIAAIVVSLLSLTLAQNDRALETVDELDTAAYLGLWYQMYSNAYAYYGYEKDGLCHQATYGDNGDGTVSVLNTQRLYTPDGPLDTIGGQAYQKDPANEPGKLMVTLDGVPFPFPYWIVKLGPKVTYSDGVEVYDYAIITDNVSASLFVLARDPATYMQKYDKEILRWLATHGFNKPFNSPIKSYQEDDCVYI
ncbi:uncharacterized protein [Ptychodera flava]|uniref:uncharacterized protein n=1 Tax=Ptychodera flava TaxID=63121 RepID=UPI003969FAF7